MDIMRTREGTIGAPSCRLIERLGWAVFTTRLAANPRAMPNATLMTVSIFQVMRYCQDCFTRVANRELMILSKG